MGSSARSRSSPLRSRRVRYASDSGFSLPIYNTPISSVLQGRPAPPESCVAVAVNSCLWWRHASRSCRLIRLRSWARLKCRFETLSTTSSFEFRVSSGERRAASGELVNSSLRALAAASATPDGLSDPAGPDLSAPETAVPAPVCQTTNRSGYVLKAVPCLNKPSSERRLHRRSALRKVKRTGAGVGLSPGVRTRSARREPIKASAGARSIRSGSCGLWRGARPAPGGRWRFPSVSESRACCGVCVARADRYVSSGCF